MIMDTRRKFHRLFGHKEAALALLIAYGYIGWVQGFMPALIVGAVVAVAWVMAA
jgi:hypothetical protein